jgi:transposase
VVADRAIAARTGADAGRGPAEGAGPAALCGILFVLHTGIQWEYLPQELGFGSGMTCWRRLAAWNEAGVWEQLHALLLKKLRSKNQLDWSTKPSSDSPSA